MVAIINQLSVDLQMHSLSSGNFESNFERIGKF